ncbi:MAG: tetratricopeptide repeat protein [Verrucomicrobiota bacterium]
MPRPRIIGWLLVLVTLLAYLPILRNGYVNFDDQDYVTENSMVKQGLTWQGFLWAFDSWHASNWHPLTWLSHMADCDVFRLNPGGHHLVNLLFHAANAWLLFVLWRRLTGLTWPGAVVAALFAWHPLHVESVAWVSERKDVLGTFFALLALLSYVRWAKDASGTVQRRFFWLAVVMFAFSLLSKPMAVTLPLVMLLLDFWPLGRLAMDPLAAGVGATASAWGGWKRLTAEKWPFFLLSLASCVVTILAQRAEAIVPLAKYSLVLRLENVFTAYAAYLGKTVCPIHLAVFYPLIRPGLPAVALSAALLAAISALVWWRVKAQPYLAVGWLWFLGTLVPVIGVLQVGDQAMADRYTYFPLIGIFFGAVFGLKDLARRAPWLNRWLAAAAVLALVGCLAGTELQLRYWRNSETLFTHALEVTPDNATARLNLGEAFQEQNRAENAVTNYQRSLELQPGQFEIYNNLGRLFNDQGETAKALDYCRTAVELNPRSSQSHNGLGMVLAELGRNDEALSQFSEAERLDVRSAAPHFQSGRVLLKLSRQTEARGQFEEALRLDRGNLAMLIYIARVLAADPDAAARNGPEALALAQEAARLAGQPQSVVLDTLAMACAENGRFDEAANLAKQAVGMALVKGAREDAASMQHRLALYEKHEAARIPAP